MKILVIGGSHGVGGKVVERALELGHIVTVFSRNPSRLDIEHANLRRHSGNVLDALSVRQAVKGQQAVICALGLPTRMAIGPPFAKRTFILSAGTNNIVQAMTAEKVKRFMCVTAIGSGDSVKQCTLVARISLRIGLRWLFIEKDRQDKLIKVSGLDWTIIRPTALTNGRERGGQETKIGENLRSGILTQVSRADVARVMLDIIDKPKNYKKSWVISYEARLGDSLRWLAGYFGHG
ncbi:MAG: SDR family oxidoreductase [bacterium]|nr:SDR family oxidoreductase [bacterium]